MLDGAMIVWFALTGASLAFVVWDSAVNGVTSWVQRAAWILVTIYTGPVGGFVYLLACRRPFPGGHDRYTAVPWKQGVNSEMHCLAGDATGIILAAVAVSALSLANGWDIAVEYVAGFVCGLFIFQALMMVGMYDGDYLKAVRKTFFAETVSMNYVMTGMIPTMVLLEAAWPGSGTPLAPAFWFRMSLATIVGGILAYPVNHWLVASGLKHGCMTLPGADGPAPGLGHRSPEAAQSGHAMVAEHANPAPAAAGHAPAMGRDSGAMDGSGDAHGPGNAVRGDPEGQPMEMRTLPMSQAVLWIALSFVVLAGALWATARFVPIRF